MNNAIESLILYSVQKNVAIDPLKNATEFLISNTVPKIGSIFLLNGTAVPEILQIFPFSGMTKRFIYVTVPLNLRTVRMRHATAPLFSVTVPLTGATARKNGVMEKNNGSIAEGAENTVPFSRRKEQSNRSEHLLLRSVH